MAKRKPLSKSIRFEVFKRDSFTCQYCGAKAPDVILEVDHIKPVAKGGTNDILNLITSCRDCNRGKSKKEISDNTVITKQMKQLEDIQARREMIEMIVEWRKDLMEQIEKEVDFIEELFSKEYPEYCFNEYGRKKIKEHIKRFGFNEVCEATEISLYKYDDWDIAFKKIGGICYNRSIGRKADYYE